MSDHFILQNLHVITLFKIKSLGVELLPYVKQVVRQIHKLNFDEILSHIN